MPIHLKKAWMTSGEVARLLDMTNAAIRRWAREGLVHAIKTPGGQYRFSRDVVTKLLDSAVTEVYRRRSTDREASQ
ncbi:MAG: helix-turn-helix domain-containing protein [Candidatus Eremiobacteraeota bacterium]|nr:helix-turn-helix domain-containing protein [Candidatus Eremiobacteraeota bacterium]MBC5826910.1 helix-turn-helix domain-containing protein [Candidatus Eremiobacteraeota bacterium]